MVADAYFSKKEFVDQLLNAGFTLVSKLRDDASLMYKSTEAHNGKKGAPKKYAGKIKLKELDLSHFTLLSYTEKTDAFSAIVYSKALKRDILLVVERYTCGTKVILRLTFSTDITANPTEVLDYYHCRFQIEFCYRDAKQATGLTHCQDRSLNKLSFHFNASLTAVNIAKTVHWSCPETKEKPFSIANAKTLCNNQFLLNRFIVLFGIKPNTIKNHQYIKELLYYGTIAT